MSEKFGGVEGKAEGLRGKNVEIMVKFMRHGERTKESELTEYGREITRARARESGISADDFDAVKAIGSNVDPKQPSGMGRALETADIYAHEIAGDETFNTRTNDILNYKTLLTKPPYDHTGIYNSHLPENFSELSDEEKVAAAKKAQTATVNHLLSLTGPEADAYKKEVAGSFAYVVDHYMKMARRLNEGSRVLIPAGTHGGTMELLLQQAMIRKDDEGNEKIGFTDISEIGGEMSPSDSYNVDIATNEGGEYKTLKVSFDNPDRPQGEEMSLDIDRVKELAEYYKELHKDE